MCTHQDLTPESHTTISKRISKDRQIRASAKLPSAKDVQSQGIGSKKQHRCHPMPVEIDRYYGVLVVQHCKGRNSSYECSSRTPCRYRRHIFKPTRVQHLGHIEILKRPSQTSKTWHLQDLYSRTLCKIIQGAFRQRHQEQSPRTTSQKSPFTREFRMKMPQTKTGAHTLCEPSQSKCAWTSQKSPFTREFRMKCRRPRPGPTLCASFRSRNAHGHLRRAHSRKNLEWKCRRPRPGPTLCASFRSRNAHGHLRRAHSRENLQSKWHRPRPRPTLCARLRRRIAFGHLTRAIWCKNLEPKCRGPESVPWSHAGLNKMQKNRFRYASIFHSRLLHVLLSLDGFWWWGS